jgi:hypothetical protein
VVADAVHLDAGVVRPVTCRIGGHRFERFVWPPGSVPADPGAIRTDGGWWGSALRVGGRAGKEGWRTREHMDRIARRWKYVSMTGCQSSHTKKV